MTYYNHRVYTITEVDFSKNPRDTFFLQSKGKQVSFADYLYEQYKISVEDMDQPLLKCYVKRTDQDVYLVPEACVLTGITEQQKGRNFKFIRPDMFANAQKKHEQSKDFFQSIKDDNKAYRKLSEKWKIEIQESPLELTGHKLKAAKVVGNDKKLFNLNKLQDMRDFSHEFTGPLKGKKLTSWAIIYSRFTSREYGKFVKELQSTVQKDFSTKCARPGEYEVRGDDRKNQNWINTIEECCNDNPELQALIVIAPGRKGASPIYDDVKYYTQTRMRVPTQIVLGETISRAKSLRNIMKNIMIQICAKVGGTPWGFKGLPLMDRPTMVVGIDVTHHVGKNGDSVLGFSASMDRYVGKYFTSSVIKPNPGRKKRPNEIVFEMESLFQQSILKFKDLNGAAP